MTSTAPNMKMVHLVRHAEAEHNGFHAPRRLIDPVLKPAGWKQVEQLRKHIVATGLIREVELVVVSPLTRTLQTAVGVFGVPDGSERILSPPPLVALELCRELMIPSGATKRSSISKSKLQFPEVDFSQIKDDEDVLWKPNREPRESFNARQRSFLQWLMSREEKNIAVVSHGAFLKHLVSSRDEDGPSFVGDLRASNFANCFNRFINIRIKPKLAMLEGAPASLCLYNSFKSGRNFNPSSRPIFAALEAFK